MLFRRLILFLIYIGIRTVYGLWVRFCNHPYLKHIVEAFNDEDFSFRIELDIAETGSTEWCMITMKRLELVDQCQKECIKYKIIKPTHSDICSSCNVQFHYNDRESTKVCTNCGLSIHYLMDHEYTFHTGDRYNTNRTHHYAFKEHFSQTLCDFTSTGSRTIPLKIMAYCRTVLGRGVHVSSENVFTCLQLGGYSAYYQLKYEIANRLRGRPEFKVTSREVEAMRTVYRRYQQEFIPFQEAHYIGNHSKMGKPRMFWPIRYILGKMCEEINRGELKVFIRGIKDKSKLAIYDSYWYKLKKFIDDSRPARSLEDPSTLAVALRPLNQS